MSFTKSNSIVVFPANNFTDEIVSVIFGSIGEIQYSYFELNKKEIPKYWISFSSSYFAQNAIQLRNNIEIFGNKINVMSAPLFIKEKSKDPLKYNDNYEDSDSLDEADASDPDDEIEKPEIAKIKKTHLQKKDYQLTKTIEYNPIKDNNFINDSFNDEKKDYKNTKEFHSTNSSDSHLRLARVRREESYDSSTSSSESDHGRRKRRHRLHHRHKKHHSSKNHHHKHHN